MGKRLGFQNEIPPARVNIRLSVDGNGEMQKQELPLKLLVLGRFVPRINKKRVGEREKWVVTRENFDGVMASLDLTMQLRVKRVTGGDGETIPVSLRFSGINGFDPVQIVRQVPELGRLLAARNLIKDLGSHLLDNRSLRRELETILRDNASQNALANKLVEQVNLKMEGCDAC